MLSSLDENYVCRKEGKGLTVDVGPIVAHTAPRNRRVDVLNDVGRARDECRARVDRSPGRGPALEADGRPQEAGQGNETTPPLDQRKQPRVSR